MLVEMEKIQGRLYEVVIKCKIKSINRNIPEGTSIRLPEN